MALYIKTEDYVAYGINKNSNLDQLRAVVQRDLKMERVFVTFVNRREFIRVDFLRPRSSHRPRRRRHNQGPSRSELEI